MLSLTIITYIFVPQRKLEIEYILFYTHAKMIEFVSNTEMSFCAILVTSRPKKPTELEGVEYHFITRDEMESALVAQRYIFNFKEYFVYPC